MSESIESLIKVTNDNLKNYLTDLQAEIEKIYEFNNIKNMQKIDKLIDSNDDLTLTLKNIKKLKLLRNKLKRMKSKKDELTMFAFKPERMDSSDEERLEQEEQRIIISNIKLGPPNQDSIS